MSISKCSCHASEDATADATTDATADATADAALRSLQDALMLGLGDMALPGLLLALVLCVDFRRESKREAALAAAGGGGMCSAGGGGSACEGGDAGLRLLLKWRFWQGGYTAMCWAGYCAGEAGTAG